MRLNLLGVCVVLGLAGCSTPEYKSHVVIPPAVIKPLVVYDKIAGDYHQTMASLVEVYNNSEGIVPKSDVFYSVVGSFVKARTDCPFSTRNFQFVKANILGDIEPSFDDGLRWNRSRNWTEVWEFTVCGGQVSKAVSFTYTPDAGTKWQFN